jgi:hypothetical protein
MDLRALIFMPALAGSVIFGFLFLMYLCHYYLTVLESTGAGAKEVTWISEPITDNFWKFCYLGWLIGLWLGPALFIGKAVTAGTATTWLTLAIPMLVLWVCYPISQLSSLSASTMWLPLVPDVFARLMQKPAVVLGFFALSAGVMAVLGVAFKWAFLTKGEWELLFAGAPILVFAVLLYARLLGRLAFVLRFTKGLFTTRKKKKAQAAVEPQAKSEEPKPAQPDELPALSTPDGELVGYNILLADEPPKQKKRVKAEAVEPGTEETAASPQTNDKSGELYPPASVPVPKPPAEARPPRKAAPKNALERSRVWTEEDDEKPTAYGVHEAEVQPAKVVPEEVVKPTEEEVKLLSRTDAPKKPKRVWGPELLAFLGQPGTVGAIVIASGLCFMTGVLIRVARAFNPVGGGE